MIAEGCSIDGYLNRSVVFIFHSRFLVIDWRPWLCVACVNRYHAINFFMCVCVCVRAWCNCGFKNNERVCLTKHFVFFFMIGKLNLTVELSAGISCDRRGASGKWSATRESKYGSGTWSWKNSRASRAVRHQLALTVEMCYIEMVQTLSLFWPSPWQRKKERCQRQRIAPGFTRLLFADRPKRTLRLGADTRWRMRGRVGLGQIPPPDCHSIFKSAPSCGSLVWSCPCCTKRHHSSRHYVFCISVSGKRSSPPRHE